MAVGNTNSASFYSISNGKICKRVQHPTESSIQRTNKNNQIVHEEFYGYISGIITDIEMREHQEYGKFWNVTLNDDGVDYILQMKYSSGYAASFLKTLPHVDLTKEVHLIPKMTVEGEKKKTTIFITQGGIPLKHFYTKDNQNGLPQLEQIKIKGKLSWDDTKMMEFLENMVNEKILPVIRKVKPAAETKVQNDDLPF